MCEGRTAIVVCLLPALIGVGVVAAGCWHGDDSPAVESSTDSGVNDGTDLDADGDSDTDSDVDGDTDSDEDTGVDSATESDSGYHGLGAACHYLTVADDCAELGDDAVCLIDEAFDYGTLTFPGGYCSKVCYDEFINDCGSGALCVQTGWYTGRCFQRCDTDDECRLDEGYACLTFEQIGQSTLTTFPLDATLCLPGEPFVEPDAGPDASPDGGK